MTPSSPRILLAALLLPLAPLLPLPRAAAQTLPNGDGIVEFIGLDAWSPDRIRAACSPTDPNAAVHYCAATLTQQLGMADAAVCYYPGSPSYVLVTVVEPQHRDRVVLRPAPEGRHDLLPALVDLAAALAAGGIGPQVAIVHAAQRLRDGDADVLRDLQLEPDDARACVAAWQAMDRAAMRLDLATALWLAAHDPNPANRAAAAVLSARHPEHDAVWWALAEGLRDADASVQTACGQALLSACRTEPRTVDWTPVAAGLRHLLAGTNLFALTHVMRALAATRVAPELAAPLLGGNDGLVLGYLAATRDDVRRPAHELLVCLRGEDLGPDVAAWRAWTAGLAPPK